MILYPLPSGKSEIYEDDLPADLHPSFHPNCKQYTDIEIKDFKIVPRIPTAAQIKKQLVKKKLEGIYAQAAAGGAPYLEDNALTWGVEDFEYKKNIIGQCQKLVVWFQGESTGMNYIKKIECRKLWCPDCGGKGGAVHKNRMHAILRRFDVDKYNIRQLVLTVPDVLWPDLQNKEILNKMIGYSKDLVSKFFGTPIFDKKGFVKKYKLEKGVVFYLHMFGDEERGVFKPHFNIHILENRKEKLHLSESIINAIKKYWLKKVRSLKPEIDNINIHYKFRITKPHKLHAIKYMSRPWGADDFEKSDESLQKFLVIEMNGFQYLRFWGALSNCNYADNFDIQEEKENAENKCGEKLIITGIAPFDEKSWIKRMVMIDKGFFLIMRKEKEVNNHEKEKQNGR